MAAAVVGPEVVEVAVVAEVGVVADLAALVEPQAVAVAT